MKLSRHVVLFIKVVVIPRLPDVFYYLSKIIDYVDVSHDDYQKATVVEIAYVCLKEV